MLGVGIVGLPNVGKSTVFNALTRAGAKVSNYPFCTIEPNLGVVLVPDDRLPRLAQVFGQERVTPATVRFLDIAGLVRGASRGEGLGNQFLSHIRPVDAVLHVVRCFDDAEVIHVEGRVDPVRDMEIVDLELCLADLEIVSRHISQVAPKARDHRSAEAAELPALEALRDWLNAGRPVRSPDLPAAARAALIESLPPLLTAKPTLYLANAGEEASVDAEEAFRRHLAARGEKGLVFHGRLEAELAELGEADQAEIAQELGVDLGETAAVIRASYELLGLVTFYTGVGDELRAWPVPRGTTAREAAGRVHSDMARGFIRAEVVAFAALDATGSWEELRRRGEIRLEGQDYVMAEGDVVRFRFQV